jgi:hypothetical protein
MYSFLFFYVAKQENETHHSAVLEGLVPRFRGGIGCSLGTRPVGDQAL